MRYTLLLLIVPAFGACDGCGDSSSGGVDTPSGTFTVIATTPARGATGVLAGTSISVQFSDTVDLASVSSGSFMIAGVGAAVSAAGDAAVLDPTNALAAGDYTVTLTNGIASEAGVPLDPYTFVFTVSPDIQRQVFATSTVGTGNLSSWSDAGGLQGIAAGDAICQARAAAAGLDGTFVAWLSDQTHDAYCRVQGGTGKRIAPCSGGSGAAQAGPWVRTDGAPFAGNLPNLILQEIYNPPRYDEFGVRVDGYLFTGTDTNGTGVGGCSDWTGTSGGQPVGATFATSYWWTFGARSADCDTAQHLLCFELGSGPASMFAPRSGKVVFATSVLGNGILSSWPDSGGQVGLAGADAICRARATAAGLSNADRFEALIADSTTTLFARVSSAGPFIRPDTTLVAASVEAFGSGDLASTINQTESGMYIGAGFAWTGEQESCGNWAGAGMGTVGRTFVADSSWSHTPFPSMCSEFNQLFCVED